MKLIPLYGQVTARAHRALQEQATKDSLTKLWNRGSLFDLLEKEILRAQLESQPIAVLMVDVDRFKLINDSYGHVIGDAVLKEVARRIQEERNLLSCFRLFVG